jgi:hypothetical protein
MRINFFGGPGCGKSTIAAKIFSELKIRNYSIEIVHEYIKKWAYMKRVPQSFDQVYIFGQQLHAEDLVCQSGVQHLVTDSPLYMQPFYARTYNVPIWNELMMIAKQYERIHPSLNIFLNRAVTYQQNGRYETPEVALDRDAKMREFLEQQCIPFVVFKPTDYTDILNYVDLYLSSPDTKAEDLVKKELKKKPKRKRRDPEVVDYTEYSCS